MFRSTTFSYSLVRALLRQPPITVQKHVGVARWVAPTLRELRRRQRLMGEQKPSPRSDYIEWNYQAELFAFGKRLHEEFQIPLLQRAFTDLSYVRQEEIRQRELGIEDIENNIADNRQLAEKGDSLAREYVKMFLHHELKTVPESGHKAFTDYLLSTKNLSHVAKHLGMIELVNSDSYPPVERVLANSLLAVIGALSGSSGDERAFLFVRDFICTQLNQRDLTEIWQIEDPMALLKEECTKRNLKNIEPRLIGDCGIKTVLAAYNVGIYADKKLIGKGFGEDISTAIKTAALDALMKMYDIGDDKRPLNFKLKIENTSAIKSSMNQ